MNELPESWKTLFNIKKQINSIGGYNLFSELMAERVSEDELLELYENFKEEFKNFPLNHPLYLEAQKLMLDMGFKFYVDDEEKQVELLPGEIFNEVYKNIDPQNPVKVIKEENTNESELTTKIEALQV